MRSEAQSELSKKCGGETFGEFVLATPLLHMPYSGYGLKVWHRMGNSG